MKTFFKILFLLVLLPIQFCTMVAGLMLAGSIITIGTVKLVDKIFHTNTWALLDKIDFALWLGQVCVGVSVLGVIIIAVIEIRIRWRERKCQKNI